MKTKVLANFQICISETLTNSERLILQRLNEGNNK